jgi:hypothetical protein
MPLESSIYFSGALKGFVPAIARADFEGPLSGTGLPPEIKGAVILYQGEFTEPYQYMRAFLT